MEEKRTGLFENGLIWFGAGVSIAEILTGTYLAPLGMGKGLLAIIVGHIIGCLMLFLAGVIGGKVRKSAMETVKSRKPQQGIRRTFPVPTKLLDSHTHIVINQHPGNASRPTEEVPVGLHEGQCVLMAEQAGKTAITMRQGKHGKEETLKFSLVVQLYFTPVKFADFSRIVILTYKSLFPRFFFILF